MDSEYRYGQTMLVSRELILGGILLSIRKVRTRMLSETFGLGGGAGRLWTKHILKMILNWVRVQRAMARMDVSVCWAAEFPCGDLDLV